MNDTPNDDPQTPTPPVETPPAPEAPAVDETDWKAEARKHEKRAKENAKAAEELEKLRAKHMSEQDKAIAKAKTEGATEAMKSYGTKLAAAEFKAAAALAGADTSGVIDLIDMSKFLDDSGDIDEKAIAKAVKGLPKSGKTGGGKSGGDFGGAPGGAPASLDAQIAAAQKANNHALVISLKRMKAAGQTT